MPAPGKLLRCPKCKTQLRAPEGAAKVKCPRCKTILKVPGVPAASAPKPAAAKPPQPLPPPPPPKQEPIEELTDPLPEEREAPESPAPSLEDLEELPEPEPPPSPEEPPLQEEPPPTEEPSPSPQPEEAPAPPRRSAATASQMPWRWEQKPAKKRSRLGTILAAALRAAGLAVLAAVLLKPDLAAWAGGRLSKALGGAPPAPKPTGNPASPATPEPTEKPPPSENATPPPAPGTP